jgi:hypothetical protein
VPPGVPPVEALDARLPLNLAIMIGAEIRYEVGLTRQGGLVVESFRLETIGELHPVAAQLFVPFAVTPL